MPLFLCRRFRVDEYLKGTTVSDVLDFVTIDSERPEGAAVQLHDAVAKAVGDGVLVPGTRLPSVRALAEQLGIATNTVAKAFKSLEAAGIVSTHGRHGTRVESSSRALGQAQGAARAFAEHARAAGLNADDTHAMLSAALDAVASN